MSIYFICILLDYLLQEFNINTYDISWIMLQEQHTKVPYILSSYIAAMYTEWPIFVLYCLSGLVFADIRWPEY